MRIQALKNAAAILEALGDGQLTKEELQARCEDLTGNSLSNLLLDLQELRWIERHDGGFRIGLGLALIHKRALDAEKQDARNIMNRLESLAGGDDD